MTLAARQKQTLAKGHMIFEMCLEKNSSDCILGFVEDQLKLGNTELMKIFSEQLQSSLSPKASFLEKETILEIEKLIKNKNSNI